MQIKQFWSFIYATILILTSSAIKAQDTTWVQSFAYNSKTRDTVILFPSGDHHQYEKILMYYNMRCKKALVSTSSDRNRGCGEWDYSCNTNIIDSSGLDSLKAIHPDFIINGINENFFAYTTKPTYKHTEYNIQNISIGNVSGTTKTKVGSQIGDIDIALNDKTHFKAYYFLNSNELSGLSSGNIRGINFKNKNIGNLAFAKIKIASTSATQLNAQELQNLNFLEVVNRNVNFSASGETDVYFHNPFNYNGSSHLVIEISYTGNKDDIQNLNITGTLLDNTGLGNLKNDKYLDLGAQGPGMMTVESLKNIKNQVTIAFWSNGSTDILPNNNSVFNAVDANKIRQLNVHLPWSNSRVFWDCGGDAAGYDRIDKATTAAEYKGVWSHWAFTKNTSTGSMKIYLNGKLWHSGTGKTKPIDIQQFVLGTDINGNIPYSGLLDDFTVWDKELSESEIKNIMYQNPNEITSIKNNILLFFDMNEDGDYVLTDQSGNGSSCTFSKKINKNIFRGNDIFKALSTLNYKPDISLIKGNANILVTNGTQRDSVQNLPYTVTPYSIIDKKLNAGNPLYYWAAGTFDIFDESGNIVDEVTYEEEDVIFINDLVYYNYAPAKFELLSFVTPYGIGLDLGKEGKTWIFDVTDYGPILKGNKRLLMDKGGEWQEEMNISFAFIKGKPTRPVLSIQQVWPATSYNYTSILNNNHLETRQLFAEPEVKSMKIRTTTTGHGQEGEFIQRIHSINVNSGNTEFSWPLWKECADNPVYPQGGTWIYDRTGWCPGAPSDLKEFEIMPFVNAGNTFSLDYGLNTATGDSRYIVNTQLVKYGEANFVNDVAIEDIINPNSNVVHTRLNPSCANPVIQIKNNGKNTLTSLKIRYGIENGVTSVYTWTGNLAYLKSQQISLPNLPQDALYYGNKFFASIENVNSVSDEYPNNNYLSSDIKSVKNLSGGIIISMKTNGMPNETKWTLKDSEGNIIKSSKTGLAAFSIYNDTVPNLNGCYQLQFTDSDQDGIAWWANGDGEGYIRAKGINGPWMVFEPDFGSEFTFNFVSGITSTIIDDNQKKDVKIFPNPTTGVANIELEGFSGDIQIGVYSQTGNQIGMEKLNLNGPEAQTTIVDLSEWPSGLYFLKIITGASIQTFKLIKL